MTGSLAPTLCALEWALEYTEMADKLQRAVDSQLFNWYRDQNQSPCYAHAFASTHTTFRSYRTSTIHAITDLVLAKCAFEWIMKFTNIDDKSQRAVASQLLKENYNRR